MVCNTGQCLKCPGDDTILVLQGKIYNNSLTYDSYNTLTYNGGQPLSNSRLIAFGPQYLNNNILKSIRYSIDLSTDPDLLKNGSLTYTVSSDSKNTKIPLTGKIDLTIPLEYSTQQVIPFITIYYEKVTSTEPFVINFQPYGYPVFWNSNRNPLCYNGLGDADVIPANVDNSKPTQIPSSCDGKWTPPNGGSVEPTPPSPSPTPTPVPTKKLSAGEIAGITIGSAAAVALIIGLSVGLSKKK